MYRLHVSAVFNNDVFDLHVYFGVFLCSVGVPDPLTLSKSFWIHNSGSTPLTVRSMSVGGGECEEHGFSVVNCEKEVTIKPNKTKKIDIM